VADYSLIRDAIAATFPEIFNNFNERLRAPGGFHRPMPARQREWKTKNGKANFLGWGNIVANPDTPENRWRCSAADDFAQRRPVQHHHLQPDDRFRGVHGTRMVLFINPDDMEAWAWPKVRR
jgi:hypothetical protein